jgi:hypothetical protein
LLNFSLSNVAFSQVINDDIANRVKLELNKSFSSTTVNCTVEANCIDEQLTGKCIVYHNDQWFYFIADSSGTYFLNLSGQHCRDQLGVQVVVIDGTPCDVSTYKILDCYSAANHDDVFIRLNGLIAGRSYLINLDGYLHDFCSFVVEISNEPKGLPTDIVPGSSARLSRSKKTNTLEWTISADTAAVTDFFEIWKNSGQAKSVLAGSVSVERNTRGATRLIYSFQDSSSAVPQHYKIVGVGDGSRFSIADIQVPGDSLQPDNSEMNNIELVLDYRQHSPITILIFDDVSGNLLQNAHFDFDRKKHSKLLYYVGELRKQGIRAFRIEVINNRDKEKKVFTYSK